MGRATTFLRIKQWDEKPIANPGVYSGIPIDVYHSDNCCVEPSISSSGLRTIFNQSARHYWAFSVYNPRRFEPPESKYLTLGSAAHHLLLGEARFKDRFAIRPDELGGVKWTGRGACAIWMADRKAEGRHVITRAAFEKIQGIADALKVEPLINAGVLNGFIETSFIWKDTETGIWLKARPDALPNDSLDVADLKLTSSIFEDALQRSIYEYGYYQQAAMLAEGFYRCTGRAMNSFSLVFCESEPPHCIAVCTLKDTDIERGHRANRMALRKFAECWKTKIWPGPRGEQRDAAYIELASWHQKIIDQKLQTGI